MEQMFRIQQEEDTAKGAFFIDSHGKRIAEILWRFEDENNIEVYRTFTDPSLREIGRASCRGTMDKPAREAALEKETKEISRRDDTQYTNNTVQITPNTT